MSRHRKKSRSYFAETMDIVKTVLLVVIAAAVVVFVIFFIKNSLSDKEDGTMKANIFTSLFKSEEESGIESSTEETVPGEEVKETVSQEGFQRDADGNIFFIRDGERVCESWLEYSGRLYYFDEIGLACTDLLSLDAFDCFFTADGALRSIEQDLSYIEPFTDYKADYPGLVKTKTLMAYLKESRSLGRFYCIEYKKTAETMSHVLGGSQNPQYTTAGTMQIAGNYIYWLSRVSSPNELESPFNGNLYRMQPGSNTREIVCEDLSGYLALSDDAIWCSKNGEIFKLTGADCREDKTVPVFTSDMATHAELHDGALYLYTDYGIPVTMKTDSFTSGVFDYALDETGEIISVKGRSTAGAGGRTYAVRSEGGRSAFVTVSEDGTETQVSGDFPGKTGSIFYNADDGYLYAELVYPDGTNHIICSSPDGYVDMLLEGKHDSYKMKIAGFGDGIVYVIEEDAMGNTVSEALDVYALTGLALSADAVQETEPETESENETVSYEGPGGAVIQGPGSGPGGSTGPGSGPAVQPGVQP